MAIRLQSATLSTAFDHICKLDEAVDQDCEDFDKVWDRYLEGGDCPLKEGVEPTVWQLTPIANSRQRANLHGIGEEHGSLGLMVGYAAAGITGVSNLLDDDGNIVKIKRTRLSGYNVVVESQIALIPPEVLIELGNRLLTHDSPNDD